MFRVSCTFNGVRHCQHFVPVLIDGIGCNRDSIIVAMVTKMSVISKVGFAGIETLKKRFEVADQTNFATDVASVVTAINDAPAAFSPQWILRSQWCSHSRR